MYVEQHDAAGSRRRRACPKCNDVRLAPGHNSRWPNTSTTAANACAAKIESGAVKVSRYADHANALMGQELLMSIFNKMNAR